MQKFEVTGMRCTACGSRVEKAVAAVPGVKKVSVSLVTNSMQVDCDHATDETAICKAVENAGYHAVPLPADANDSATPAGTVPPEKRRLILSLCFLLPLMYLSAGGVMGLPLPPVLAGHGTGALCFALTQLALTLPIYIINRALFIGGWKDMRSGMPGTDTLAALGSGAALGYGVFAIVMIVHGLSTGSEAQVMQYRNDLYFGYAAVLLTLIAAGKLPEAYNNARTADKVSGIFAAAVIGIAAVTVVVWLLLGQSLAFALARSLSVLVITCPCMLGLATPLSILVGSGVGDKNGLLFKTATGLERIGRTDIIVLDKTGTVTTGEPEVTEIIGTRNVPAKFLLGMAAGLEARSEQPLARAILRKAAAEGITVKPVPELETIPGKGLRGKVTGKVMVGGSAAYVKESCPLPAELTKAGERLAANGIEPLYFGLDGHAAGLIGISDAIKKSSAQAIAELNALGLQVVLLTGDDPGRTRHIGARVGLDEEHVIAGVLPADKETEVHRLQQNGLVAVVGDGLNDAPALARADIGIAIGAGADVALNSADVVLRHGDLADVPAAVRLSRKVVGNIRENLFWTFLYNAACIPLAAGLCYPFGILLNPMAGAAVMGISGVCVVVNALRLNRFDPHSTTRDAPARRHAAPAAPEPTNNQTTGE